MRLSTQCTTRKERNGIVRLIAGVWQGNSRKVDKGRHQLCLGKEDIKHTFFSCLERGKWRMQCPSKKWFDMNKVAA